jgi:hypothetical protein
MQQLTDPFGVPYGAPDIPRPGRQPVPSPRIGSCAFCGDGYWIGDEVFYIESGRYVHAECRNGWARSGPVW